MLPAVVQASTLPRSRLVVAFHAAAAASLLPIVAAAAIAAAAVPPLLPPGITVSVKPANAAAKGRPHTASVSGTTFSVGPVVPGDYVISAHHPHWQLEPASATHSLGLSTPQLAAPFTVMGYRVSGSVTSKSGPVAGIQVGGMCGCERGAHCV